MTHNIHTKIRKVVFPVGGLGTRFLPATKSMPKEMLPVVDKPLIHYAFEEAQKAGIEQFIFITGRNKSAINNHFDHAYELQDVLLAKSKLKELKYTSGWLPEPGTVSFIRQQEPMGLGHAIWSARYAVGDEPFAVILADELIHNPVSCLKQMIDAYQDGMQMVGVQEVPRELTFKYGILDVEQEQGRLIKAKGLVEKPKPEEAPSTLSITGRYILQPAIFDVLAGQEAGVGGEIQLTDAIRSLHERHPVYGYRFEGQRFDCGSRAGFIKANIALALDHPDIAGDVADYLRSLPLTHQHEAA